MASGSRWNDVGRIASWASWALRVFVLNARPFGVVYSGPKRSSITRAASAIAWLESATESVRIYVIRPTWPSSVSTPSYRRCAALMVRFGEKPSLRLASCCRLDVVNGGAGERFVFLTATSVTIGRLARIAAAWRSAVSPSPISGFLPPIRTRSASNVSPFGAIRTAFSVQYSRAVNARISRSRSTTIRTATDCTRPAESPARTLRHSKGLSV